MLSLSSYFFHLYISRSYTSPPPLPPPPSPTPATPPISPSGQVTDLTLTNAGNYYVTPPLVSVERQATPLRSPQAVGSGKMAILESVIQDGRVVHLTILYEGQGYRQPPKIVID